MEMLILPIDLKMAGMTNYIIWFFPAWPFLFCYCTVSGKTTDSWIICLESSAKVQKFGDVMAMEYVV